MKLIEVFGPRVKLAEPLKNHTTYRIGGPADFYLEVKNADEATKAIKLAKDDRLPFFILGGGSNILFSDAGFRGLVLVYAGREVKIEGSRLIASAGAVTFLAVKMSSEAGLAGLEWAAGIPGTIGGAIRGNAGAYGGEIKDTVSTIEAINMENGEVQTFDHESCLFGYRDSVFKHGPWLITRAAFNLSSGDRNELMAKAADLVTQRRAKLPLEYGSAGSVFKNFYYGELSELSEKLKNILPPIYVESRRIPAGFFTETLGLKGKRIGDAMISEKHGNFFVNTGSASAAQVRELIFHAKMKVKEEFGVILEEEIQYVGFDDER
jgi:UDP-N-acetylmuramate dehydrogenase